MALNDRKITVYANPVANLPDHPSQEGFTAERLKAAFDAIANEEVKHAINGIIDDLIAKGDGSSGADQIGATAINDLDGATVQAILESLRNKLKSTTDNSSGADFIGATGISNLDGTTVQAILESLRNKLKSTVDGSSGADFIGSTPLKAGGAATVQGQLLELVANISTVNTNETTRQSQEAARVVAENARTSAETSRTNAETSRNNAESSRATAENNRELAEQQRVEADILRGQTVEAIEQNYAPRLTSAEQQINTFEALDGWELKNKTRKPVPLITFVSDDGHIYDFTKVKPIFDTENVPCVCAIIPTRVGTTNYMTMTQIATLQNSGWEVASHTYNHLNLTELTDSECEYEIGESKKWLNDNGFNCNNFCVPYGFYGNREKEIARKYYRSSRSSDGEINTIPHNTFALKSVLFGEDTRSAPTGGYLRNDIQYYKAVVDDIIEKNAWVIFLYHSWMLDETQLSYLQQTIQYAKSKPVEIVTINQALDKVGNIVDVGNDVYKRFVVGCDGTTNIPTRYTGLNSNKGITPISSFPTNSITINDINTASAIDMPEAVAGLLITYRFGYELAYSFQEYHIYNTNNRYRRYSNTSGVWQAWFSMKGVQIENSLVTNSTPITDFHINKASVNVVLTANAAGLPENKGGILITFRSGVDVAFSYQTYRVLGTNNTYTRYCNASGVWQLWVPTNNLGWNGRVFLNNSTWTQLGTTVVYNYVDIEKMYSEGGSQTTLSKTLWAKSEISTDSISPTVIGTAGAINVLAYLDGNNVLNLKYSASGNNYYSYVRTACC